MFCELGTDGVFGFRFCNFIFILTFFVPSPSSPFPLPFPNILPSLLLGYYFLDLSRRKRNRTDMEFTSPLLFRHQIDSMQQRSTMFKLSDSISSMHDNGHGTERTPRRVENSRFESIASQPLASHPDTRPAFSFLSSTLFSPTDHRPTVKERLTASRRG